MRLGTDKAVRFGFALCVVGLLIALSGLLPSVTPRGNFNWMVIAGSAVYLPGAVLAFMSAKGRTRNQVYVWLRMIRIGFFGIIAAWMLMVANGTR